MTDHPFSTGRSGFIAAHSLWSTEDRAHAAEVLRRVSDDAVHSVRLSFADQHGILRGKSLVTDAVPSAFANGVAMTSTLLLKDTSHRTVYPVWQPGAGLDAPDLTGAGDFIMVPIPGSFRMLPWAPGTGWLQCEIYHPDGRPVVFSTRRVLAAALDRLAERGLDLVVGIEIEFHVLKLEDAMLRPGQAGQPADPPAVSLLGHGFQYLTEFRADELDAALSLVRKTAADLGMPLRTLEVEFGPSQIEATFEPQPAMAAADLMVLFRGAIKQACRRQGIHATFMCRPHVQDLFSSGWHLHQSLLDRRTGANTLRPAEPGAVLSPLGLNVVAGQLRHAPAAALFTTPTVNGYKRYQPYALAPDRLVWGVDNKGALIRVIGGVDEPGTRIENRAGEPAANPYLYIASQVHAGLDGMENDLTPPDPTAMPYGEAAPSLPESLGQAIAALRASTLYRQALGDTFTDYILHLKEAEWRRFLAQVTDWEQREYFEIF